MFSPRKPTDASIAAALARAPTLLLNYAAPFYTQFGSKQVQVPSGCVLDRTRTQIGQGQAAFEAARTAMQQWMHFDLGWVRVANPDAQIQLNQIVAVEARSLGLWSVNLSRILYLIDENALSENGPSENKSNKPSRFGFGYGTTTHHIESGEERFLIEYHPASGKLFYDLLAVSRPAHWMARLAYPYTRSQQLRFARESHAKMKRVCA